MSGILPTIVFPSNIKDEQDRLRQAAQGTDESVRACTSLDQGTRAAWGDFYATVLDFTNKDPAVFPLGHDEAAATGARYDRAQSYEQELLAWQKSLASAGCTLKTPIFDPTPADPPIVTAVKWAAVGAVAIAGAYGVSKLVEILPHWRVVAQRAARIRASASKRLQAARAPKKASA